MKKKSISRLRLNKKQISNFNPAKKTGGNYISGTWTLDEWCYDDFAIGVDDEENPNPINMCFGEWW